MQCPKCQFGNAGGMNFCGKCGTKLERSCPQCNFGNPTIKADSKNGMSWHLGQDHAICSRLCKRKGDTSKAQENHVKAIEIFKVCGADGWVEKYEKELSNI